MNKCPQTIADLKINWIFTRRLYCEVDFNETFRELNPNLFDFKIKKRNYLFLLNDHKIRLSKIRRKITVSVLIDELHFAYFPILESSKSYDPIILDYFELVKENTFKIHVK